MRSSKRILMVLLAVMLLASSLGAASPAPNTWSCAKWHTVRYGQTLSSIAAYYGVYWPYLAQINNIQPPFFTIYTGTVLCIPTGGYYNPNPGYKGGTGGYPYYYGYGRTWNFSVSNVTLNTSVTIRSYNFPSYVTFNVKMGTYNGGAYSWVDLPDLNTGSGGNANVTINIPASLSGTQQLVLRLIQVKKNGRSFYGDQAFYNGSGGTGGYPPNPGYYPPNYYYGIPTIWIVSVKQNDSVTIQTRNFPPNLAFEVRMGYMGTRGWNGFVAGTLNSGNGGTMVATFPIPTQLYGQPQISIRTQNYATGYFSYNWFWNNTAY